MREFCLQAPETTDRTRNPLIPPRATCELVPECQLGHKTKTPRLRETVDRSLIDTSFSARRDLQRLLGRALTRIRVFRFWEICTWLLWWIGVDQFVFEAGIVLVIARHEVQEV